MPDERKAFAGVIVFLDSTPKMPGDPQTALRKTLCLVARNLDTPVFQSGCQAQAGIKSPVTGSNCGQYTVTTDDGVVVPLVSPGGAGCGGTTT